MSGNASGGTASGGIVSHETAPDASTVDVIGHLLGAPHAPARVVVYGTFECLHCRRAWPALRALAEESAGRVAVEWRHFAPAGAFPNATGAALAAEAAGAQERRATGQSGKRGGADGAYWAMHEALMTAPSPFWPERVDRLAAALGLDVGQLRRDAASDTVRARVEAQREAAVADGVRGTPTALLDGMRLDLDDLDGLAEHVAAR